MFRSHIISDIIILIMIVKNEGIDETKIDFRILLVCCVLEMKIFNSFLFEN
jgi:hypothetical protein